MKLSRNRAKCPSHGFCICKNRVQPFQKAALGFILFMPQGIRTLPRYRAGRTAEGRGALRIRLIPRIRAVAFVLAQIQPPHAGKHHEHDADVSEQGGQPLPATQDVRGRTICRDWSFDTPCTSAEPFSGTPQVSLRVLLVLEQERECGFILGFGGALFLRLCGVIAHNDRRLLDRQE